MIWFLDKQGDLLVCEIRKTSGDTAYEFEVADSHGPTTTHRFESPTDLIAKYLNEQSRLIAEGWRPSAGDLRILSS